MKKKRKKSFRSKIGRKTKEKKKIPDQRSEENKRKYSKRSSDQTIFEQYKIVTSKQEKTQSR